MDRSSAVNVMLYAAGDGAFAEWHIFPGRAIESIYDQLLKAGKVKKCAPGSEAQFFLQQRHFLDPKSHDAIAKMCGHACWHIEQRPGDAVFIPPRCPHQVHFYGHRFTPSPQSSYNMPPRYLTEHRVSKLPLTLSPLTTCQLCRRLKGTSA